MMMRKSNFPNNNSCIHIEPEYKKNISNKNNKDSFIVGIGTSAGGLDALKDFFKNMPPDNNMVFIVIHHLSPDYNSFTQDILSQITKMKIFKIQNGMPVEPGCIYLNLPKYTVTISKNRLYLKEHQSLKKPSFLINSFFKSLAEDAHKKAIGIILSGTGSDGTLGCRAIKESGGVILAQDAGTAKFNSMPNSVISAHICDFISAPKDMPEIILQYTGHPLLANERIHGTNKELKKLIELSPFTIIIIYQGKILFSNTAGLNLFQMESMESLIGKSIDELLYFNPANPNEETEIIRPDGSKIYVDITSMPFSFEEKDSQLLIIRDVTPQKIEMELRLDNEKQKKLISETLAIDELKNVFFSNLSHELRTPLNVIMSTLQLLESDTGHEKKNLTKLYGIMRQNCYRQLRLINNMIDITKIDSGFFEIKLQNHDIISVVENITLSVSDYIKNKGIELIFDTNVEEKIIACDLDSIERIILNLLSNAIKFTNPGGTIKVKIKEKQAVVLISVKDTGKGIPEEKCALIFDRFRQADKKLNKVNEGSGIGLSLVKSLVELHDGIINVKSKFGKGTEFIIEIPSKKVSEEEIVLKDEPKEYNNIEKINIEFSDIYNLR